MSRENQRARAATLVLVEEVTDGGWGVGGTVLTAEMLGRSQGPRRAGPK